MQTTLQRNASSVYSGSTQFSKVSECVLDLQKVFQGFRSGINLSAMPKESSWRLDHLYQDPLVQIFMVFTSMVQKTTHKHAHTKAQGDLRLNSQTYFIWGISSPLSGGAFLSPSTPRGVSYASIYAFLSSKQWIQNIPPWPIGNLAIYPVPAAPRW